MRCATALLLCVAVAGAGCGSIQRETPIDVVGCGFQRVTVHEGERQIASSTGSPVKPALDPSRDHDLEIRVEGFEPAKLRLESRVSGGRVTLLVVECLILPIVGLPILLPLAIAGDTCEVLEPESPRVELRPKQPERSGAPRSAPTPSLPTPEATPPTRVEWPSPTTEAPPATSPASAPKTARFCAHCGAELKPGGAYCAACGAKQ